jgi:tRNA pseudouridine32 synthase/23S rRNA pseudouridine746 synthase
MTQIFHTQPLNTTERAVDALARCSGLSKAKLKEAMTKGAVWLLKGNQKQPQRLRRATSLLRPQDKLTCYFAEEILAQTTEPAILISDEKYYSVWDKPSGMLAQGTREADHCALSRQAEKQLCRPVWLVHRLDREASGLMLVAHTREAAAKLSALFAAHDSKLLKKTYLVNVRGQTSTQGTILTPLDGKDASTQYRLLTFDATQNTSKLEVSIETGRKHQIRRHFADNGTPVWGDPLYGTENKNTLGLQLRAVSLTFFCPFYKTLRDYNLSTVLLREIS